MIRALKWLRRYWYIPLLAVGGFLLWVLLGRWRRPGVTPIDTTIAELEVIRAGAEADHVRVEMGTAEAVQHVKDKYAERRAKLTAEQRAIAAQLESDPEALARFIVRGTGP